MQYSRFSVLVGSALFLGACVPEGQSPLLQAPGTPATVLETCAADAPKLARLAIGPVENAEMIRQLATLGIDSPSVAMRVLAQQSRCFDVIEFEALGRLRGQSGTPVTYVLRPSVSYSAPPPPPADGKAQTPAATRAVGPDGQNALELISRATRAASASATVWVVESESGRQVAIGQGNQQGADFDVGAALLGPQAAGLLSGFTQRVEGRAILGALVKSFNAMLEDARNNLPRDLARAEADRARAAAAATAQPPERVAPPFRAEGRYATVAGVNFRQTANGTVLRQLSPNSIVVTTGKTQGSWWEVTHDDTIGWLSAPFLRALP